jgi:coproporphyrinogen III oxidase-like Fe-S oxidoreductase
MVTGEFRGYVQTTDDRIRGAVIEECLSNGKISKDAIEARFQIQFDDYSMAELMRLNERERDALVEGRMSRTIRITSAGRIFVRAAARFRYIWIFTRPRPRRLSVGSLNRLCNKCVLSRPAC